jgi:hypothetical protein
MSAADELRAALDELATEPSSASSIGERKGTSDG